MKRFSLALPCMLFASIGIMAAPTKSMATSPALPKFNKFLAGKPKADVLRAFATLLYLDAGTLEPAESKQRASKRAFYVTDAETILHALIAPQFKGLEEAFNEIVGDAPAAGVHPFEDQLEYFEAIYEKIKAKLPDNVGFFAVDSLALPEHLANHATRPSTTAPEASLPSFESFLSEKKIERHTNYINRLRALATLLYFHVATLDDNPKNTVLYIADAESILQAIILPKFTGMFSDLAAVLNEVIASAPNGDLNVQMSYRNEQFQKIRALLPKNVGFYGVDKLALPSTID